jgi:hypothetical protein
VLRPPTLLAGANLARAASVTLHGAAHGHPERQLRRSISEFNMHANTVPTRRHLYSLCLQRIMLVEFEYLAHQSRSGAT